MPYGKASFNLNLSPMHVLTMFLKLSSFGIAVISNSKHRLQRKSNRMLADGTEAKPKTQRTHFSQISFQSFKAILTLLMY